MSADAARIIGEATTEELREAAAYLVDPWSGSADVSVKARPLAAAALALIIEGRKRGTFFAAARNADGLPPLTMWTTDAALLRALAGDRKEGT